MAKIQSGPYPHIHSGSSTHSYMFDLPITTYTMAVVAIILQFFYSTTILGSSFTVGIEVAIRAALVIFVAVGSCLLAESLWWRYADRKYNDFAGWFRMMSTAYPTITGMLYALILPINTPLYIVFIGGFVSIILGKTIFGGIGQNIFNPALVGRAFVTVSWAGLMGKAADYANFIPKGKVIDGYSSVTPLTHLASESVNYLPTLDQITNQFGSFWNLVIGLYPGALGEGISWWIILAFIFLAFRKTINWYIPTIYVGLVFAMTWVVGLMNDLGGGLNGQGLEFLGIYYPLFSILTGGLLFGAVFMATEPVTSPMTKRGKVLFSVYLAILTFAIRMLGVYPEGVLFSILIMNMFVQTIDNVYSGQNKGMSKKEWAFWIFTVLLIVGLTYYAGTSLGGAA